MQQWYRANAYFLCGVAAGREKETKLGDVLIPDQVTFFGPGRHRGDVLEPRPDPATIDEHMYLDLGQYKMGGGGFQARLAAALAALPASERRVTRRPFRPKLHMGNVALATSEQYLENAELLQRIADRFDEDIDGADMEAFGFVDAIQSSPWAIFRGVSDFGGHPRSKDWQSVAALTAAVALRDFLEEGYLPPDIGEL
jgi:nucleoside phosphorylase